MGWLSNKIDQWSLSSQQKELNVFVGLLRAMDGPEIGLVVAMATNMRHALEGNGRNLMDPIIYATQNPAFNIFLRRAIVD